jgi:UDP-2-acetamido-3-amino-2,3-dideoxy-glucuronate N-acetyltransferase
MAVFDDTRPWAEKLALYRDYLRRDGNSVPAPNKLVAEFATVPEAEPLRAECTHFIECCRDRRAPRTDGAEGERVLRVLHAAQSSLDRDGEAANLG